MSKNKTTIKDELILLAEALDDEIVFSDSDTIASVLATLRPIILLIIAKANNAHITFKVVDELPTEDIKGNVIYLVPNDAETGENTYDEWMYIEGEWQPVGNTRADVDAKEDKANKATSLSDESTDTQYPSAKCVYDALGDKEASTNKVTFLSNDSTDEEYPSAKCVYDAIGDIETLLSEV